MIILPLLAGILGSSETILSKFFMNKFNIKSKEYLTSDFIFIAFILTLFLPFFYQYPHFLFNKKLIFYFAGVLFFAILGNLFYFKAIKSEDINKLEPLRVYSPFFGVIIAFLFFREEINTITVTLLLIATFCLILSRESYKIKNFSKGSKYIIISIIFLSFEPFLLKEILQTINPIMLYYVRAIFISIITYLIIRPNIILFQKDKNKYVMAIATMSTIKKVLLYFGYLYIGVLNTILIVMIRYPLEYIMAKLTLKEKLNIKNILSSLIILICVITYTLII